MFGFFAPPRRRPRYRQVYAACCSHQRQLYGTAASVFHSYEAIFLYLLALEAGACEAPAPQTPTCCRLRNDWANHWNLDRELADFCAAFAMLLARTKLEDDKRDSRGFAASLANRILRKAFAKTKDYFEARCSDLLQNVSQCIEQHVALESDRFVSRNPDELLRYAEPTANAFGHVFEAFGMLCKVRQSQIDVAKFRQIGCGVGATILVSDCMFDFEKDRKRGEFTPLCSRSDQAMAKSLAISLAADLGWSVAEIGNAERSLACDVVTRGFKRIERFQIETPAEHRAKPFAIWPRRPTLVTNRAGDCDCGCDCCCEGCTACGSGDCDIGCCDGDGENDFSCLRPSCDLICPCDDGSLCQRKKRNAVDEPFSVDVIDPLIGREATVASPMKPTGFICVEDDDKQIPAQLESGYAQQGDRVVILRKGSFGYIVKAL